MRAGVRRRLRRQVRRLRRARRELRPRATRLARDGRHLARRRECLGCTLAREVDGAPLRRLPRRDHWHHLAARVEAGGRGGSPLLVVLGGRPEVGTRLADALPDHRVVVVDPDADGLVDHLAVLDPPDVLLDLGDHRVLPEKLFVATLYALRPGGLYLASAAAADRTGPTDDATLRAAVARLVDVRQRHRRRRLKEHHRGSKETDRIHLARALGAVEDQRGLLAVTKAKRSMAKLDEDRADRWLAHDPQRRGSVLRREPAAPVPRLGRLRENESSRSGGFAPSDGAPAATLREYLSPVCQPGQVVTARGVLLPDTYRHITRPRLLNRYVADLARDWGRPTQPSAPAVRLPGTYYYLDSEFRGHFGHAMTEQVSRLWGWRETLERDPDARALVGVNAGRTELARFELELFAAAGIPADRIELITGPVVPERLVGATPLFGNPRYVHPLITRTWGELGERLAAQAEPGPRPTRLFCSRRTVHTSPGAFGGQRRVCHNGAEVEEWFAARGFTVVFPDDFTMAEQAAMFRGAEIVAGYAGSALFNLIFASAPVRVVVISSESYTAQNEFLISGALGHQVDVVWCPADLTREPRQWSSQAFNSPFRVDFTKDGEFLERAVS